jgi:hypothetical protein
VPISTSQGPTQAPDRKRPGKALRSEPIRPASEGRGRPRSDARARATSHQRRRSRQTGAEVPSAPTTTEPSVRRIHRSRRGGTENDLPEQRRAAWRANSTPPGAATSPASCERPRRHTRTHAKTPHSALPLTTGSPGTSIKVPPAGFEPAHTAPEGVVTNGVFPGQRPAGSDRIRISPQLVRALVLTVGVPFAWSQGSSTLPRPGDSNLHHGV